MPEETQDKQVVEQKLEAEAEEKRNLIEKMNAKVDESPELDDEGKDHFKRWIETILVVPGLDQGFKVNRGRIDAALETIDEVISRQVDEVIHNEQFQKLESAWRGLYWQVEHTDFNQNIKIGLISVSKQELLDDFKATGGDSKLSGLYKHIYREEFGAPNGKPFGAIIANYEFAHGDADVALMQNMAEVSAMAHAPMIGGVSGELFGQRGFDHLNDVDYNVKDQLSGKAYAKWNGFRDDQNAKYVGLAMPHFLLRSPYNSETHIDPAKSFNYNEKIEGRNENYLWGNAAFAFASRLTESFAKYRWCWRIAGEKSGGAIPNMHMHTYMENGELVQKPPTDVGVVFSSESELNDEGLIPLSWYRDKDMSVFFRAPSFARTKQYPDTPEGNRKTSNEVLRTYLPYQFIMSRFAHYLKRIQTSWIGKPTTASKLEKELNDWLNQYKNQNPMDQGRYPLYDAGVTVERDERDPGLYHCDFWMIPHGLPTGFSSKLRLVTETLSGQDKS